MKNKGLGQKKIASPCPRRKGGWGGRRRFVFCRFSVCSVLGLLSLGFVLMGCGSPPALSVATPQDPDQAAPRPAEVLHASDGLFSVWNYDTGLDGTLPGYVTTLRWWSERGMLDRTFQGAERLGWVEGVAVFKADAGRLYVLYMTDRAAGRLRHARLLAFLVRPNSDKLETLERVFPEMPGTDAWRTRVDWTWTASPDAREGNFGLEAQRSSRACDVWLLEKDHEILVRVRPERAAQAHGGNDLSRFAAREFRLCFNGREFMYRDDVGAEHGTRTTARLVR